MTFFEQPRSDLRRKLLWLIGLRAASVTFLLGTAVLVQINAPGALPIDPFVAVIAVTYALTVVYAVTLDHAERYRWLVDVQLACDALTVAIIIFVTGGVTSYFSSLQALPIVAASVIQSRRGGYLVATLSAVVYVGIVSAQYLQPQLVASLAPPGQMPVLPPASVAEYTVALNVFGLLGVAMLSGHLAEGLRHAGARLERASSQIADLQAFNQHVIESLTSGLATTDHHGTILTFNRTATTITGHAPESVTGSSIQDVLQLPHDFQHALDKQSGTRWSRRLDMDYTRADGRRIDLGLSAAPLLTSTGRTGYLFTFQDVTDTRRLEREVRMQQRLAAVGEMAAGIAHEIRNPLASMAGSIQILRQELPLTDEHAQLMDIVLRESERLNETIGSFLAYARPLRLATRRLDLGAVLHETATLLRNSSECSDAHRIDVAAPPETVWFDADEGQIRQIVWNLATNGLRAMPSGGTLVLRASFERTGAAQDGASAVLSVEDEGVGMEPAQLDSIFQPFKGAFPRGAGLGLAIVHRIVSDYRGEIQVTSERGIGTAVRIRFSIGRMAGAAA